MQPCQPTRLLVATRTSPLAGESGSGAYLSDLLGHLSRDHFRIHAIWTEPPDLFPSRGFWRRPRRGRSAFTLDIMDMHRLGPLYWRPGILWLPAKARALHAAKTALARARIDVSRRRLPAAAPADLAAQPGRGRPAWNAPASPAEIRAVQRAAARFRPDAILVNYAWMAATPGRPSASRPPVAILSNDVWHRQLHIRDGRPVEILNERTSAGQEISALSSADAIVAIQDVEAAFFRRILPGAPVVTAPVSVRPRPLPPSPAPDLLFVGSPHTANRRGLDWFLREVWPLLRATVPETRLLVAGTICAALPDGLPRGVEKLGRLPDLAGAYARARVVIIPLLQGSGMKTKLVEAVSHHRAVVTTSVGAEGFDALRPALRVADTPAGFAAATAALLATPGAAAAVAGQLAAAARVHFSPDACYAPLARLLRDLAAARRAAARPAAGLSSGAHAVSMNQ